MTDAAVEGLMVAEWNAWPYRDRLTICNLNWAKRNPSATSIPLDHWVRHRLRSEPLVDFGAMSSATPGTRGTVLLTEPQRQTGDRFLPWVRERGWKVETELIDLGDQQREIRLFRCTLDKIDA